MRVPAPTWTATTDAYCGEMKRGRHPTEVSRASRAEAEPPAQLPLLSPVDDDSACRTPSWNGRTGSCGREVWRPAGRSLERDSPPACAERLAKSVPRPAARCDHGREGFARPRTFALPSEESRGEGNPGGGVEKPIVAMTRTAESIYRGEVVQRFGKLRVR